MHIHRDLLTNTNITLIKVYNPLLSHHEQNPYVRTAVLNKETCAMTCAVSFQLQISVAFSASSFA